MHALILIGNFYSLSMMVAALLALITSDSYSEDQAKSIKKILSWNSERRDWYNILKFFITFPAYAAFVVTKKIIALISLSINKQAK